MQQVADPRTLSVEQLTAVAELWYLEDGDFCAAERVGEFSQRPSSVEAIVASRQEHNSLPDDERYSQERWHFVMEEGREGQPLRCLAIARSFVRQAALLGADGESTALPVLGLCAVVADPATRRQGHGAAVVRSVLDRLQPRPRGSGAAACLFATELTEKPYLRRFYADVLGCTAIGNTFVNSSSHAGGELGPFDADNDMFVLLPDGSELEWDESLTVDLQGRGW